MSRRCTICSRKELEAVGNVLVRHSDDHIPAALVKAQAATEAARADDLLAEVVDLRNKALGILKEAERANDWRTSIAAIREARGCVELLGKLAGQLREAPTLNLFVTAEWREVQGLILSALDPNADPGLAVESPLVRLGSGHAGHA